MNKREERSHKFKLLFSTLFYEGEEKTERISHYSFEKEADDESIIAFDCLPDEEKAYLEAEVLKILEQLPELDSMINADTEGWTTKRMSKTDLTVLRLSLYELKFQEDIPKKVVLNEAVEIAKKYGGADSGSFVNGVLARILPKLSPELSDSTEKKEKKSEMIEKAVFPAFHNDRLNSDFPSFFTFYAKTNHIIQANLFDVTALIAPQEGDQAVAFHALLEKRHELCTSALISVCPQKRPELHSDIVLFPMVQNHNPHALQIKFQLIKLHLKQSLVCSEKRLLVFIVYPLQFFCDERKLRRKRRSVVKISAAKMDGQHPVLKIVPINLREQVLLKGPYKPLKRISIFYRQAYALLNAGHLKRGKADLHQ